MCSHEKQHQRQVQESPPKYAEEPTVKILVRLSADGVPLFSGLGKMSSGCTGTIFERVWFLNSLDTEIKLANVAGDVRCHHFTGPGFLMNSSADVLFGCEAECDENEGDRVYGDAH